MFSNDAAVIRLVGAILTDMHDERQSGERRYPSEGSKAQLHPTSDTDHVAAIDSGAWTSKINPRSLLREALPHRRATALPRRGRSQRGPFPRAGLREPQKQPSTSRHYER
jgi:hypothetical protein